MKTASISIWNGSRARAASIGLIVAVGIAFGPTMPGSKVFAQAGRPADAAAPAPSAPPSSGLARRPTPKLAERSESGSTLKPIEAHRRMGAIYHTVAAKTLLLTGPMSGLVRSPTGLAGYVAARVPMNSASNGALGRVVVAGQWQVPWSSLVDRATLDRWSAAAGGPLKLEEFPFVALTIRNAADTRLVSRNPTASTYMCTVVADITVNGVTTERVIPRTLVTFLRGESADPAFKGEQLSLRATWTIRLADFFASLPGEASVPNITIDADLLMSTVSPDAQTSGVEPAEPVQEPVEPEAK